MRKLSTHPDPADAGRRWLDSWRGWGFTAGWSVPGSAARRTAAATVRMLSGLPPDAADAMVGDWVAANGIAIAYVTA